MACSFDIKVRNGIINKVSEEVDKSNLFDRNGTVLTKKNKDSDVSLVIDNINNKYKDNVISPVTPSSQVKVGFAQGKQFQKLTAEEKAKTIEQVTKEHRSITALKDLATKLAYRIGGKVEFQNHPNADWKGYNQGMTSVLNEAYMALDTPFHEILGHSIIRSLKTISKQQESVYLQDMIDKNIIEKKCS